MSKQQNRTSCSSIMYQYQYSTAVRSTAEQYTAQSPRQYITQCTTPYITLQCALFTYVAHVSTLTYIQHITLYSDSALCSYIRTNMQTHSGRRNIQTIDTVPLWHGTLPHLALHTHVQRCYAFFSLFCHLVPLVGLLNSSCSGIFHVSWGISSKTHILSFPVTIPSVQNLFEFLPVSARGTPDFLQCSIGILKSTIIRHHEDRCIFFKAHKCP